MDLHRLPHASNARRRLGLWLATLALALNLLAPGLCLAQMLASGPLGAICSAAPADGIGAHLSWPDDAPQLHGLEHCGHCAAPGLALAGPASSPSWRLLPAAALPQSDGAPAPATMPPASWRPPPRGPPLFA